jgi:hypothetical protein
MTMMLIAGFPLLIFVCFLGYRIFTVTDMDIYEHYH